MVKLESRKKKRPDLVFSKSTKFFFFLYFFTKTIIKISKIQGPTRFFLGIPYAQPPVGYTIFFFFFQIFFLTEFFFFFFEF